MSCGSLFGAEPPTPPDWALPGSATHQQVPPPADFHRPTVTLQEPIGLFSAQSDIGGALVPGDARFDAAKDAYEIRSAGYNIWYTRDEFRYLWRKASGSVYLAASIQFPNTGGYGDRKAVLVIRQDLDDDSKEVMVALHGAGLIHLAERPHKGANIREIFRYQPSVDRAPFRLVLVKERNDFMLKVGEKDQPPQPMGLESHVAFNEPFYVGIGFCSHQPVTSDSAVLSDVVLQLSEENRR